VRRARAAYPESHQIHSEDETEDSQSLEEEESLPEVDGEEGWRATPDASMSERSRRSSLASNITGTRTPKPRRPADVTDLRREVEELRARLRQHESKQDTDTHTKSKSQEAADRRSRTAKLTGDLAPFPTLGMLRSRDPALNMAWEMHARFVIFKWKTLLLMLRARRAMRKWRRDPGWLARLHANETASLWGHLGAATRLLRGPKGPPLYQ